ncbi:crotonase/enoyl-CoA hydratase family protein [Enterovirga sp. CN4-39]|uniref:crotonase/enoyl-CoA hydratase family protein n=1 Tax=Enterovirga sp. CN4-39 TaxID=3400910 RepID=UPI003C0FC72B
MPQLSLDYEPDIQTLWITLRPEPKPVFTLPLIESVGRVQDAVMKLWGLEEDRPVRYLAYRSSGAIFSLGGDLDYYLDCLRANDRAGLRRYADQATNVIRLNRTGLDGAVITLTNVRGKAIGGGIDPARACNVMIAEEGATFSYPEINFNHFPISAVPVLSRHTGPIEAEKILLSAAEYSAAEFQQKGAVDEVVPAGAGDDWIRRYAARSLTSHSARVSVIAAFNQQAGERLGAMSGYAEAWTDHILRLKPIEIAKLQRIAAAQERMLSRMLRSETESTSA